MNEKSFILKEISMLGLNAQHIGTYCITSGKDKNRKEPSGYRSLGFGTNIPFGQNKKRMLEQM
jgi:hypothetical protein